MQSRPWINVEQEIRAHLRLPRGDSQEVAHAIGMPYSTYIQQVDAHMTRNLSVKLFHGQQAYLEDFTCYRIALHEVGQSCFDFPDFEPGGGDPERLMAKALLPLANIEAAVVAAFDKDGPGGIQTTDHELRWVDRKCDTMQAHIESVRAAMHRIHQHQQMEIPVGRTA